MAIDSADSLNVVKTLLPKLQTLFVDQRFRIEPVDHAFHHFLPILEVIHPIPLSRPFHFFSFFAPKLYQALFASSYFMAHDIMACLLWTKSWKHFMT